MITRETLKENINKREIKRLYLFFAGDEYIKNINAERIIDAYVPKHARDMNVDIFDGLNYKADAVFEKCDVIPFFADKRVIIIKNSGLFSERKKDGEASQKQSKQSGEAFKTEQYIERIPDTSIVIFIEEKADKRLSLYKKTEQFGECVEFTPLKTTEMSEWIIKLAKSYGKTLNAPEAAYFLQITPNDMGIRHKEIEKLCAYSQTEIKKEDMLALTTKSLEADIFRLTDAIGAKNLKTALTIYENMLFAKESPFMILTMLARQFRHILTCADYKRQGANAADIAKAMGLWDFAVKNYLKQSANFKRETLKEAMRDCLKLDSDIKKGLISDNLGVEMLIVKYSG